MAQAAFDEMNVYLTTCEADPVPLWDINETDYELAFTRMKEFHARHPRLTMLLPDFVQLHMFSPTEDDALEVIEHMHPSSIKDRAVNVDQCETVNECFFSLGFELPTVLSCGDNIDLTDAERNDLFQWYNSTTILEGTHTFISKEHFNYDSPGSDRFTLIDPTFREFWEEMKELGCDVAHPFFEGMYWIDENTWQFRCGS